VKWALDKDSGVTAITSVFAYPTRAGFGTVDVVAFHAGSGAARSLSGGEVATLLAWLKTKAPAHLAGTPGALRVLTSSPIRRPSRSCSPRTGKPRTRSTGSAAR
jgi:hypothetical protein